MDKKWYLSKTIWGVLISVVGKLVAVIWGVEIDPAAATHITDTIVVVAGGIGSLAGDALAIYGRTKVGK